MMGYPFRWVHFDVLVDIYMMQFPEITLGKKRQKKGSPPPHRKKMKTGFDLLPLNPRAGSQPCAGDQAYFQALGEAADTHQGIHPPTTPNPNPPRPQEKVKRPRSSSLSLR